jgi:diadenosine tetraphosphate (Ap4A) HIT family hydrolase
VAINENQNLLGKLIIVLRRHEESVATLTTNEWAELFTEVQWATGRLREAFAPDHFNYAFLQNEDRHVHFHVIPRYAGTRRIASTEFRDAAWPAHYEVGVTKAVSPETMQAIRDALVVAAPR